MKQYLQASRFPESDIETITPPGQPPHMRMYQPGYAHYMNTIPYLSDNDPLLDTKIAQTKATMEKIAKDLAISEWVEQGMPGKGEFNRVILALEPPMISNTEFGPKVKEGAEIVLARWGAGFSSPVHGHANGYLHEQLIFGKIKVNTYRITDYENSRVRPLSTEIITGGTFAAMYTKAQGMARIHPRTALVHNFTAIEPSASLHFLQEHTRDGRDNRYHVDHFEEHHAMGSCDFTPISAHEGMYLKVGDVALVRSGNVPEYGDHFIVVTGPSIMKEHGMRPQEFAIQGGASASAILDSAEDRLGLRLLKMNARLRDQFLDFHGIALVGNKLFISK